MKITNNVLAGALFVTLLMVIGGTWISLNYIDGLTGAATTYTGTTNVTVSQVVSCVINDSLVSFGVMSRGDSNDSGDVGGDYMMLTNDGNDNISIAINATQSLWIAQSAPTPYWAMRCDAANDANATCTNTWTDIPAPTSPGTVMVSKLSPVDGIDNVSFAFNLTVPSDEPFGYKNGTIRFTCSATV